MIDRAAERRVLASLLRDPGHADRVPRELFTEPRHLVIFDEIFEARDVVAVFERLGEHRQYVLSLLDPQWDSILQLDVERLRACRARRQLHSIIATLRHTVNDAHNDPRAVAARLQQQLADIATGKEPAW